MTDEKNFIKSGNALVGITLEQGERKEILKRHNNSLTFSIWTMAGTVLAACTSPIFSDIADLAGGGGGGDTQSGATVPARTFDGPVDGARFFMDNNNNGQFDNTDTDLGTTNGVGRAEIAPPQIGAVVYADVNGALDIATGEILSGVWQSLPYDGSGQVLISPLTDLLSRQLMEPTNADDVTDMGQDAFLQNVLDDILVDSLGDAAEITVADVLNHENYNPVGLADASLERQIITTAAIELTVIYENAADATDSAAARMALKTVVSRFTIDTDTMTVSSATPEVQNRLGDAQDRGDFPVVAEVNGGEPIRMTEDQDFTLVSGNAERLFGFEDPLALGGEEDSLVGIYIQAASTDGNVNVMFRNAENGIVALADADRGVVASTPAPYDNTFFYVSAENFGRLILRPDTNFNTENNPNPEIRFYVYDGEHATAIVENAGELLGVGELEIAVASVNDAPELTVNAVDDAVTEAGGLNNAAIGDAMANGSLTITDPDTGHNAFTFAGNTLQGRAGTSGAFKNANGVDEGGVTSDGQIMGTYGTLTLERDGTWSYALRDDDPDTQALDGGNTPDMVQDVFEIQLVNVDGTTQTSAIVPITIDVTGADDATTITSPASDFGPFEVVDPSRPGTDDAPTATGTFSASDPDDDITWSASATGANSGLGTVTFVGNRWTFTLTDPAGVRALNDLASGDTTDITFDIAANGVDAGRDLTITLRGAADTTIPVPVIGAFTGNIADADPASDTNAPAPVSGTFSPGSGDVDRWMAVPRAGATEYGTIVVTGSQWTFTLNPAGITEINRLDAGETTDAVFDVTATNAGGADTSTLTISLTGIDDNSDGPTQTAPVIPAFTGSIVDDNPASDTNTPTPVSGTFSTTSGTANTWAALPQAGATEYGTISVTGAQWTFTLNNAGRDEINRLDAGGTTDVIFDVTATNAGGSDESTLTISLTGIEDNSDGPTQTAPEIPAFTSSITDADPASDTNTPAPVSGTFATSSGTADTWMAEPQQGATAYGTIVVTGSQWTFTLNPAGRDEINRLDAGGTTDVIFDVTATNTQGDGTSTLTISLTGIVDNSDTPAPVIGAFTSSIVDDDPASDTNAPAPVSGTFSTTSGTADTWTAEPQQGATAYGTIVVTGSQWTFTLNAAGITEINRLDAGETTDAVFDVTAENVGGDGTSTLTISLTGIEDNSDGPTQTALVIPAFTGSITDADPASDTNAPAPVSGTFSTTSSTADTWVAEPQQGTTEYGTIVVTGAQWTFTLNAAGITEINRLDAGGTTDAVFDVTATNAQGADESTLTISLTGIVDNSDTPAPVIGAFTGSIADADPASDTNAPAPVSGTFSTTSGTADTWMAVPRAGTTAYGTISVTGSQWTFTLNAAGITEINRLDAGDTPAQAVFDVTAENVGGDDTSTLTISLTGIEDNSDTPAPVIAAFTGSITDADPASDTNTPAPVSGTFSTTSGTADTWMAELRAGTTEYGTISVTGSQWTFTLNAAGVTEINTLDAGETTDVIFDVTATNVGGANESTLTISLTGIDDNSDTPAPVIGAFTGSIADADPASDTNAPTPDSVSGTFSTTSGTADGWMAVPRAGATAYGTIVVTGTQWTFTLNAAGITEINRLDAGETTDVIFDVTATNVGGDDTSTLTISLTGIDDNSDTSAPVIGAFTGSIADADPASDTNAPNPVSGTFSTTSGTADGWMAVPRAGATEYGTIVVTGTQWTFTLNAAGITEINTLDAGDTPAQAVFDVTATNVGGSAESTLTISLTGIDDNSDTTAPVIPAFTGSIADADPASDTNAPTPVSGTFSTTSGTADGWMAVPRAGTTEYGTIVVTGTQWTFTLNAAGVTEINRLDAGDTPAQAVFDVTATNVGGADRSTLTISLTGIVDNSDTPAPVIPAFTGSIADDDAASDTTAPNPDSVSGTFATTSGTADGWMAVPRAGATAYGTIVVTGAQWTFTLNAAGITEINRLDAGETTDVIFDVTATNVGGADESTLTISLTGIEDNSDTPLPVIVTGSQFDALTIADTFDDSTNNPDAIDGAFTATGTVTEWSYTMTGFTGDTNGRPAADFGSFTLMSNGEWTFDPTAAINMLTGSQSVTFEYAITAANVAGSSAPETFTITLQGVALPVLGEEANAEKTATEAGHELDNGVTVAAPSIAAMGSFTHTDANAGQGDFDGGTVHIKTDSSAYADGQGRDDAGNVIDGTDRGTAVVGTYGTIYLRADGDWYYVLDDARTDINALTDGASSLVDEFEVRIQETEDPTIVSNVLELTISIAGKNDAPSSITASSTTTTYSGTAPPPGHIIATLTSTDPDSDSTGNTYSYAIDMNSADAPSFMIIGNQLQFASSGAVDRNAGDSWTVGVISTASDGLSRTETFTIMRAGNAAPTDIITDVAGTSAALTATYDGDDVPIGGHLVATFSDSIDVNADDTHRYSIVPSTVDDSGLFTIRGGNQLVLLAGSSPTLGDTLEVTVRTTDAGTGAGGLTFDKTFTITRAGNVSPTDITTTDALTVTYDGNDLPSDGRRVLTLGTTDLNADDSHTYSITGGMHASSFAISGNELRLATSGGVSVAPGETWQVTITTTDSGTGVGGLMFEEDFTITRAGNAFPEINTGTSGTAYDTANERFVADVTDPNRGDTASAPTATGMIVAEDFETAAAAITYSAARAQGETNNYGSITFDPANPGAWTFTLTTPADVTGDFDGVTVLNALTSATDTAEMDFTVTADDGAGGTDTATLRITLRGAPAAIPPPAITSGDMAGTITDDDFRDHENIPASDSGTITATGSDIEWSSVITGISGLTGDLASRSAADFGSLTLTPSVNGNSVEWVFTPTALINELRAADTNVMITYTITARNGGGEVPTTLTINLDGANDAPVLTQAEHAPPDVIIDKSVMEAGGSNNDVAGDTMARGSLINTDIDMGQSGFGAGKGNTVQGAAGTSPTDADFNALGNDDAEGGKGTRITGVYGDLFLKNDGTWTYELDDDRDATQSLNGPDTNISADRVQDVFTIRVQNVDDTDTKVSNEVEISIDVTGADDDLVLDDLGSLATIDGARVDEIIAELAGPNRGNAYIFGDDNDGAGPNVNQIFTARDPDSRDADLAWSVEALSLPSTADTVYVDLAEYGMFEVDEETGDWRFLFTSAGRRAFDEIDFTGTGVGEDNGLRVIPIRVTVTNDRGISVSDTFEITLEGRAEAPMIADENSNDFNVIFSTPPTSTLSGEIQAFDPDMPLDPQDPGLVWTHEHTGGDDTLVDFQFMGVLNQSTGFTEGRWTLALTPAGETKLSQRGGAREDITYRITVTDNNDNTDTEDFTITLNPPSSDVPPATGLVDLLPGADVNLQFGYDHFGQGQFGFARGGGALPDASVFTDSGDDNVDIQIGGQLAEPFANSMGQLVVDEPIYLFEQYQAVQVERFGILGTEYEAVPNSRVPVPFRYSTDDSGINVFQNRRDVTYEILNPDELVIDQNIVDDHAAHRDKSSNIGTLRLFPDGRWTYALFTDPGRAGNSGIDYYRITYRRIDSGVIQENDHDIGIESRTGIEISDTYILRINVAPFHPRTFTNTINRFFNEQSEGIITGLFDDVDMTDIRQYSAGGLDAARSGRVAETYVDTTPRGDEVGIFDVDTRTGVFTYNFTGGGRAAIEARLIHTDVGNDPIIKREIPVWGVDNNGNIGTTMVEVSISGLFRLQVQASSPDITSMPDRTGIYPNTLAIGDHRDNTLTLGNPAARNFIFAHEGDDTINLAVDGPNRDSPEDVIYHRFSSAHDSWVNYDGADTINNFDRATDTFILVDRDTGSDVNEPEIFGSGTQLQIHAIFGNNGADKDSLAGFTLRFSNDANSVITFNYLTPRNVSNSAEAARFFGNGRASLDESDGNRITDHGLFEVYFGSGRSFQVIEELPQYLNDYTDTDIIFRPIDDPADLADRFITGAGDGEILIGDSRDNTIRPAGGQDHIVGGRGDDEISLSFGDDSVYHRFSSDSANWINIDGSDHITGFRRREDAFIFLDIDTTSTVDEAAIKGANTELQLFAILEGPAMISGVYLVFENDLGGVVRIDYRQDERITITAGNEADFFGTSPNTTSLYNNDGEMLTIRRVTDLSGIGNFFGDSDDQFQVLSQLPRILADILPEISNIGDDIPMDSGTATPGPAIQPFTLSPANEFTHDTLTHGELIFTAFRGGDTTPPTVDRPQVGIELTFGGVPGSGVNVTAIGTGGNVVTIDIVVATDLMDGAQAVTWQTIRDAVNTNGHTAQHVRVSYAAGADGTGAPDAFDTLYADRNGKLSGGEGTPEMPAMDAVALTPDTATFGDLTFTSMIEGDSRLHDVKQVRLIFTDSATGADPIVSVNDSSNSVTDITISVNRDLDATTWDEVLRAYNEHTASTAPNGVTTPAASRVAAITTSTGFDLSQSLGNYFAARPSVDNHFTQAGAAARLVLDGGAGATALVEVAPTFNMLAPRDWPFEFTSVKAGRTWRESDVNPADFAPKIQVDLVFRGGNNRDPLIRPFLVEQQNDDFNPDPNKTRTTLRIAIEVSDNMMNADGTPTTWGQINDLLASNQYIGDDRNNIADGEFFTFRVPDLNVLGEAIVSTDALDADLFGGAGREGVPAQVDVLDVGPLRFSSLEDGAADSSGMRVGRPVQINVSEERFSNEGNQDPGTDYFLTVRDDVVIITIHVSDYKEQVTWQTFVDVFTINPKNLALDSYIKFEVTDSTILNENALNVNSELNVLIRNITITGGRLAEDAIPAVEHRDAVNAIEAMAATPAVRPTSAVGGQQEAEPETAERTIEDPFEDIEPISTVFVPDIPDM